MNEVAMSLSEIRRNFGDEVAKECESMNNGETREIHTATYEAIIVRCEKSSWWGTTYYVTGENIIENALELDDGMDMDM